MNDGFPAYHEVDVLNHFVVDVFFDVSHPVHLVKHLLNLEGRDFVVILLQLLKAEVVETLRVSHGAGVALKEEPEKGVEFPEDQVEMLSLFIFDQIEIQTAEAQGLDGLDLDFDCFSHGFLA